MTSRQFGRFKIRRLVPEDREEMIALLETRDGFDAERARDRLAILEHIAFKNPQADNGETTYYVVEEEGRIIAIHGRMPTFFVIRGERKKGYYVHDLYVHRANRQKGQGFWLTMELAKEIERESDSFICLYGMTDLNLQMQRRRKYHEIHFDAYVKVLDATAGISPRAMKVSLMRAASQVSRVFLGAIDRILFAIFSGHIKITKVDRFDRRFDAFLQDISGKIGVCTSKTAGYLNWKYVDCPFQNSVVFAAERGSKVTGFVAVGFSSHRPVGVIKDIMADPDDTATSSSLIIEAVKYLRRQRVRTVWCALSDKRFVRVLRRFLFFRMKDHEVVFIGNLDKFSGDADFLKKTEHWHVTYGESDRHMLGTR